MKKKAQALDWKRDQWAITHVSSIRVMYSMAIRTMHGGPWPTWKKVGKDDLDAMCHITPNAAKEAYESVLVVKFGDNTTSHPLLDNETWCDVTRGVKKGQMDTELPSMNLNMMNQEFVKLDRFDGQNYSRWADKVKFLLAVLKLGYLLDPELPPIPANPVPEAGKQPDLKAISDLEKQRALRRESEQLCLGHIKNSLSDRLYDLYAPITDPRELWKALELKYKAHEEGTNKYLVSKYLEYQMVDDRSIMEQVHELQVLVNKLTTLSIALPELFQVGAIIAKLPPSWRDFSKRMMHKSEDYSLDDLLKHLRIEEETRNRDK
ncbi:hypothetical protein L2E82_17365 [Cichorium intybus]|uniref:Uncharacterized protein n=1 Tax=Cichorium intybus TaxID=13427 RepID=A0ACB9F7F5_CICIN|nr:hypothetical protein L2E82_17365 [Cichorium intybus]